MFDMPKIRGNYTPRTIIALKPKKQNVIWEVDLVGPLPMSINGFQYILTVIDHFSKLADVRLLRTKEANEVCIALEKTIEKYGVPEIIISDNGREFVNSKMDELAIAKKFKWRRGAPYTPTTTGLVERFNRTYIEKLRKVSNFGKLDWAECVQDALIGYLESFHRGIGCAPIEMTEKKIQPEQESYIERYKNSYIKNCNQKKMEEINIGDKILYHHPVEKRNKLMADFNQSGIVQAKRFGSVDIKLVNGKIITTSLRNVKRLFL